MAAMTCIVSVEKLEGDRYGKICIVTGNRAYIDSIEHPAPGTEMLTDRFTPNTEYTNYLTRDLNFEDYCYRAAVKKKCLHSYAHPDRLPVWLNMSFMPLGPDDGNICYCMYVMEINFEPDSESLSNTSGEIAEKVLETCVKLRGSTDFKATMADIIKDIRDLCDAEHCCILTMDEMEKTCGVLCEALSDNTALTTMEKYVDDSFFDIADSWKATIMGSNCLIVKNEQDMEVVKERNPVWHESLTSAGARNIVLFPLKSRDQLLGYIWAINYDAENVVTIKDTLEITTFILGSELGNYLLLDRLKVLSSKDMLTGVNNRNEMNNYVDSLCSDSNDGTDSVGVIFADLNGLKRVNDTKGHTAGDTLLKDAASALREVFSNEEIFRAGGDEFCLIVMNITMTELEKKMDEIRKASEHYDGVFFALGGSVEFSSRNVRLALRHADENMYEDKAKFYREHPELEPR